MDRLRYIYTRKFLPTTLCSFWQGDGSPLLSVPSTGLCWAFAWVVQPGCNHLMGTAITLPVSTLWIASKVRLTGDSNFLMERMSYQVRPWAWIFETVWVRQLSVQIIKGSHPLVLVRFFDSPEGEIMKILGATSCSMYIEYASTYCVQESETWTISY